MGNSVPYFAVGFVSLLLQVIVLREMLSVFSGNELDIGVTLSFWLLFVGAGSLAARKITHGLALGFSFIAAAVLSVPTVAAVAYIRPAFSVGPGEAVSLGVTVVSTALILFPLCTVLGAMFPLAVAWGREEAGKVYGVEAAGAFAGGVLFTFILSGRAGSATAAAAAAVICALMAAYVIRKRSLIALAAVPLVLYAMFWGALDGGRMFGLEVVQIKESRYGKLMVLSGGGQSSVYQSGALLYSYPEPQGEELTAHLAMALKPGAKSIFVIGGSPGALRELLRYPVDSLDFVETDPALIGLSFGLLSGDDTRALKDERLHVHAIDARRFVKGAGGGTSHDLILLNLPPPSTANGNRFFTVEFFSEMDRLLDEGGLLMLRLHPSAGYMGAMMAAANASVYNALRAVFPYVHVTAQDYGVAVASGRPLDVSPDTLYRAFKASGLRTEYFDKYIIDDAFDPLKVSYVSERLRDRGVPNTDRRPAAYLYNLMLWAETHGGGGGALNFLLGLPPLLVALGLSAAAFAALPLIIKRKERTVYYVIFSTGYAGMGITLSVILGYQAAFGFVYETIGLITALFMAGITVGTFAAKGVKGAMRTLFLFELAVGALALLSPLFFGAAFMFYLLSLTAGAVTGFEFTLCTRAAGKGADPPGVGGGIYGFELMGSFTGAMLSAVILVPLLGVTGSLYIIVAFKAVGAAAVWTVRNEEG